ncbi:MAG: nucleoside hydrolase-like domain-containing protein [Bacteroidota bacterium]
MCVAVRSSVYIYIFFWGSLSLGFSQKPQVWIYTDMSDKEIPGNNHMQTLNDPDDISAMAGYLLMANMFDTQGIVVASTHREEHKDTPNQAEWANQVLSTAYRKDVVNLNKWIGGFPDSILFMESCIKESSEWFQADQSYQSLDSYDTVKALFDLVDQNQEELFVLCWGSLTEPAILVKHCIEKGRQDLLSYLRFVAHWTNSSLHQGSIEHPEDVANCREDAEACKFLKEAALNGHITYYECGAIGQHGIVSGAPVGAEFYEQFKTSNLGKIFAEGKFVRGHVDHSDAATYWTLLGDWGLSLADLASNGRNYPEVERENEEVYTKWSFRIHNELLRRSKMAARND